MSHVFHFRPKLSSTVRRGRAQRAEKRSYVSWHLVAAPGSTSLVPPFLLAVDLVSRYTNSTLVAEPAGSLPEYYATTSSSPRLRPTARLALAVLALAWWIHPLPVHHIQAEPFVPVNSYMPPHGQKKDKPPASGSSSQDGTSYMDLRDSYVPVFTGQPADYREWRQRIQLYHRKMSLTKRANESVLNIVGTFTGVTWRLFQDWGIEELEKEDAFKKVIETLDANFSYDAKVQLPTDFEAYFNLLQRSPGQTLLLYVADHEEAYRRLQQHRIELPASVQGWHLRRSGLSREQRQLITLKAPNLEKNAVIEALYLILGQDYKGGGWNAERNRRFGGGHSWKQRAYMADDYEDEAYPDDDVWEAGYYEEDEQWAEEGHDYEVYDDGQDFDHDAGYYGEEEPWPDNDEVNSPSQMAAAYDAAFASYTDARRRFQELKTARGYLPIVALTDGGNVSPSKGGSSSNATSPASATSWRTKGKGKGGSKSGKSKTTIRYPPQGAGKADPKGRARANMTCLRCGQAGHWAANCPQSSSSPTTRTPGAKRPASSTTEAMALERKIDESALLIFQDSNGAERPECVMLDPGASALNSCLAIATFPKIPRSPDHLGLHY